VFPSGWQYTSVDPHVQRYERKRGDKGENITYVKTDYFVQCTFGDCIAQVLTLEEAREVADNSRYGAIVFDGESGTTNRRDKSASHLTAKASYKTVV